MSTEPELESDPQATAIPPQARFLCAGRVEPSWVSLTLQLDAAGCHEPSFRWIDDAGKMLTLLREESFDGLILEAEFCRVGLAVAGESEPERCELAVLRALRGAGCDDPVVLLTSRVHDDLVIAADRYAAELLVSPAMWYSPALGVTLRRAVERTQLVRDHYRLSVVERRRSRRDREEAAGLLHQQRRIIEEFLHGTTSLPARDERSPGDGAARSFGTELCEGAVAADSSGSAEPAVPTEIVLYYHELLRTFVIIGSGSLASEIRKFAESLAEMRLSPRQVMRLHLGRVEELVRGLGSRSSRHVLARADLLALEVMIYLAECFQQRETLSVRSDG